MKYPCKLCLVKPACSQDCNEYKLFMGIMSDVVSPIIFILSGILLFVSAFYVALAYSENAMFQYMQFSWLFCILILIIVGVKLGFNITGGIVGLMFAPIMAPSLLVLILIAKKYKRA